MSRFSLGILAALALASAPSRAAAQVFLYEDWSGGAISPNRWRGGVPFLGFDSGLESQRAVRGGQLVMSVRQAADAAGAGRAAMNVLELAEPAAVTTLRARLNVREFTLGPTCAPGSPGGSEVDVLLILTTFKDGAPTATGDRTNDVVAGVFAFRGQDPNNQNGPDALNVHGIVFKCGDAACAQFAGIAGAREAHVGVVATGTPFRPRVTWDEAGDRFLFGLDDSADVPIDYGALGVTDTAAPGKHLAALAVSASSAGCWNNASVKAAFDEIRTNVPAIVP